MSEAKTDERLTEQILQALGQVAPEIEATSVDPATSFRDQFEFDSVDFLNFALALEKKLDVRIPELDYPKLSTLSGCIAYLKNRRA